MSIYRKCFGFALFVVNADVITYNAALTKKVYQSSVFIDENGVEYPPELANDGRSQTRCARSNVSRYPWWAVDLGRPMNVYRVDLTNVYDDKTGMNHAVASPSFLCTAHGNA